MIHGPQAGRTRLAGGLGTPLSYAPEASLCLGTSGFEGMLGGGPQMQQVFAQIREVAVMDVPVLVVGENGTGKGMAALAIHRRSARRCGPFVPVNCGALPEALLANGLFGDETGRRAWRGQLQAASGGTLFLEEVERLPSALQIRLWRFLQERNEKTGRVPFARGDFRIVAGTSMPRSAFDAAGWHSELYRYLATLVLHLPPLRERGDDILLLAQAFLKKFAAEDRKGENLRFTRRALCSLVKQSWPGNVRQLENCVRRAVILAEGRHVTDSDLACGASGNPAYGPRLREAREALERELIGHALTQYRGNMRAAAELLGISRATLYELVERLGIEREP